MPQEIGTQGRPPADKAQAERLGLSQGIPPTVLAAFAPVTSVDDALLYARTLTGSHYENFSMISVLLPRYLRQHFCNVYAFCRVADDLGDEVGDKVRSEQLLRDFRQQTLAMYDGKTETAVFTALKTTVNQFQIPPEPFLALIDAFMQDQRITRYDTFEQVLDYCTRSADPVGRLVLYMCEYRDEQRQRLSDRTCSALQLANFWQDIRRDFVDRDRIYLPRESMAKFSVSEDDIRAGNAHDGFRAMLKFEVDRAQALFDEGKALLPLLRVDVRKQIALFGKGGEAVLHAIRRQNYDTLSRRPTLSRWQKGKLIGSTLGAYLVRLVAGRHG